VLGKGMLGTLQTLVANMSDMHVPIRQTRVAAMPSNLLITLSVYKCTMGAQRYSGGRRQLTAAVEIVVIFIGK